MKRVRQYMAAVKLMLEDSDRDCAISVGARLDEHLEELLKTHLVAMSGDEGLVKGLLNGKQKEPLSTFSSRVKMSVAMGLVPGRYRKAMLALGSVRNDFAHRSQQRKIKRDHVDKLLGNMDGETRAIVQKHCSRMPDLTADGFSEFRLQFTIGAALLIHVVLIAIDDDRRRLRVVFKALASTSLPAPPLNQQGKP